MISGKCKHLLTEKEEKECFSKLCREKEEREREGGKVSLKGKTLQSEIGAFKI